MSFDVLLCIICGGFMSICGGFGTYGCYRCFTDKEGERRCRVHSDSEYTVRNLSVNEKGKSCFTKKLKLNPSSSSSSSSFNGTIYTVNSSAEGSALDGRHHSKIPNSILPHNHDFALSINPSLVNCNLPFDKGKGRSRRLQTAPM